MKKRITWFGVLAGVGMALGLALSGCGKKATDATASTGTTLRFGYPNMGSASDIPQGVVGWAYQRGLLQPELAKIGIDKIEFVTASGQMLNQAFAAGAVDIFTTGDTGGIIGRGAGLEVRLINIDMLNYNIYLVTRPDGPKTVQDLAGGKVASGFGANPWHFAYGLLVKAGLKDKTHIVNLPTSDSEAALLRGDIDAMAVNYGPIFARRGFRVLAEARNGDGPAGLFITVGGEAFLKKHPRFAEVWNGVIAKAVVEMQAHPDEFYKFMTTVWKMPEDVVRELYPLDLWRTAPLPGNGIASLEETKRFFLEHHVFRKDFSLRDWVAEGVPVGDAR